MNVESYLFFNGFCEEALDFYKGAIGAQVHALLRMKESPEPPPPGVIPDGSEEKVMHALIQVGDTKIMASDGMCSGGTNFQGFALSLNVQDAAQAERFYNALLEGGEVKMPLGKTFWSPCFGMVCDKFGVTWMVTVAE